MFGSSLVSTPGPLYFKNDVHKIQRGRGGPGVPDWKLTIEPKVTCFIGLGTRAFQPNALRNANSLCNQVVENLSRVEGKCILRLFQV